MNQTSSPLGSAYGKHTIQTEDMAFKNNINEMPKNYNENNNNNNSLYPTSEVNIGIGSISEREPSDRQKGVSQDKSESIYSCGGKRQIQENGSSLFGHERHKGDSDELENSDNLQKSNKA